MLNPFDLKSALLARHAQHVVLIHFPIALYLAGTCFDLCARLLRRVQLVAVATWNIFAAAAMTLPAALSGLLAWHFALEGQPLKGLLRLHLYLALATLAGIWLSAWLRRSSQRAEGIPTRDPLLLLECAVSVLLAMTAHLGGFLSGVNS